MDPSLLALPLLALADSTSIGTLVIPVLVLLVPGRPPVRRLLAYLAVVAGLYVGIGLVLLGVADVAAAALSSVDGDLVGVIAEAVLGAALLAYAVWPGRRGGSRQGRLAAWRERALDPQAPLRPLLLLAVLAVAIEAASMLPYIGAIALVSRADLAWPVAAAVIAAYCLIMVLPAVVLAALRVVAADRLEPVLQRIAGWSRRTSGSPLIRWAAGIVGIALIVDAVVRA